MSGIRQILPPTCGETATFWAKLIGSPLSSDFYSRLAAGAVTRIGSSICMKAFQSTLSYPAALSFLIYLCIKLASRCKYMHCKSILRIPLPRYPIGRYVILYFCRIYQWSALKRRFIGNQKRPRISCPIYFTASFNWN